MTDTPKKSERAKPRKPKAEKTPAKRAYRNGLCKRGKVYWVCVKRNGKKIERSTGCRDKAGALVVLNKVWNQLGLTSHGIRTTGPFDLPTLEKAAREWYAEKEGHVSERYREQMMEAVLIHMKPWKKLPVSEITSDVMTKAVDLYQKSPGTKTLKGKVISTSHSTGGSNRLIRLISALYGWLVEPKKLLAARPWTCGEESIQKLPRSIVWPEDVKKFLEAMEKSTQSKNIRLSIRMQIGLGLRESETSSADWRWLDRRNAVYRPGKTKNKDTREIPVPKRLFGILMAEWEAQGRPMRGLILPYGEANDPIYRGFTKNAVASAGAKIGVDGLHPHRMRATFATAHFEDGTTIPTIMLMLGHKHEQTTFRYIERRSKDAREAQDRVEMAMGL